MRLTKARVSGYRSIIDTGYFDVEELKTIFVGPNEAGKTAILQAIQKLNPPAGVGLFDPLRDYPRSRYDKDIECKSIDPSSFTVVEGHFCLTDEEKNEMPEGFKEIIFVYGRYLDNKTWTRLENGIQRTTYTHIEKDLKRISAHILSNFMAQLPTIDEVSATVKSKPIIELDTITANLNTSNHLTAEIANKLVAWMDTYYIYITEGSLEESRYDKIKGLLAIPGIRDRIIDKCKSLLPKFVLFNNYFRVRPSIHLGHLTDRIVRKLLDDDQYDYGNLCLLKLLGFSAQELSEAGNASASSNSSSEALQKYKDTLDKRKYRLNAASVRLTDEIKKVWNPDDSKGEASKLRIDADGQYLKVVVEDALGVEVELDQRSEGFQWLVSFFVVFFSEANAEHKNAILLLDEPGLSLHGLKQAEFRKTLSRLSEANQTIFTTHSPFLVGADELALVRVVEMTSREAGTVVHTTVSAGDSAALLPLQEALGYDLAQSLFLHQKNLVLEGLTDYWYIEAMAEMLREARKPSIEEKVALNPANSAGKLVYYATILHAQGLKVAAMLDSDAEGDLAASQETLVNALGNKRILRTKDVYTGSVQRPEIEDIFRDTLVGIAKDDLGWDVEENAAQQVSRPIVDIFSNEIGKEFSKYKLSKAFLRWVQTHGFSDLKANEQVHCMSLASKINKALK